MYVPYIFKKIDISLTFNVGWNNTFWWPQNQKDMHESAAISIYLGPNKPLLLIAYSSAMSTTQWQIHRIGGITFLSKKIVILPYILKKELFVFLSFTFFLIFFQW